LSGKVQPNKAAPAGAEKGQTLSAESPAPVVIAAFPLSWSQYVQLLSVDKPHARAFYETEAIRGGWSVRQLQRQISTQFFERTARSKQQAAMLTRGQKSRPEDAVSAEDEVRDPYLLEFLNLKDEYSESELEDALIRHLEWFLLELGAGFTFVARQKRIRIGQVWYRIDLLLFHRGLSSLVLIDLKNGHFTHADAGQMNLYLNYAKEHLMISGEADPFGIILCSSKDDAVVEYAMGGINARVFASKYLTQLPDQETLRREIETTRRALMLRETKEPKPTRSWEVRPAQELKRQGTVLRLTGIRSTWTERMFRRLSLRLSRLLSPFRDGVGFTIRIESDEFPQYSGEVRADFQG
jgi:predicted nuclease of restriction endonuclease-like (RecB) superfamily